ncbi:MAG: DUF5103 domain-containing protein, partial [Bacteroidaceae bacterium]|nr:DUF5103 domain-containing protein [Bacteroidaceae bacterium]
MKKSLFILCWICTLPYLTQAQENICFSPRIKTLQVKVDGEWGQYPVVMMGHGHGVEISFDDLQAQYQRYT